MSLKRAAKKLIIKRRLASHSVDVDVYLAIEPFFSKNYYSSVYDDIAKMVEKNARFDPILHYLTHGADEGRDPNPNFSTNRYRNENRHLLGNGQNPFHHYIKNEGTRRQERRAPLKTNGSIDDLQIQTAEDNPGKDYVYDKVSEVFDTKFYIGAYRDIADALKKDYKFDPIRHYVAGGWREGRDPSPTFSTSDYLRLNSDVRHAAINPYFHYVTSGQFEGRTPKQAIVRRFPALEEAPRVLFVGHSGNMAGAERMLLDMITWYAGNTSYNIDIFILNYGPLVQEYQKLGNIYVGHKDHYASDIADFPFVKNTYSYIYCNTVASARFSEIYDRFYASRKVPLILHVHEMHRVIMEYETEFRKLTPNVSGYIAASATVRDDLCNHFSVDIQEIDTVESFINQEEMGASDLYRSRLEARSILGLREDDFVIVAAGTVYHRKGPDMFTEVLRRLSEAGDRIIGVWLGDGPDYHAIRHWVSEMGLSDRIIFTGFRQEDRKSVV